MYFNIFSFHFNIKMCFQHFYLFLLFINFYLLVLILVLQIKLNENVALKASLHKFLFLLFQ